MEYYINHIIDYINHTIGNIKQNITYNYHINDNNYLIIYFKSLNK